MCCPSENIINYQIRYPRFHSHYYPLTYSYGVHTTLAKSPYTEVKIRFSGTASLREFHARRVYDITYLKILTL